MCAGLPNDEIACEHQVSLSTAKGHRRATRGLTPASVPLR